MSEDCLLTYHMLDCEFSIAIVCNSNHLVLIQRTIGCLSHTHCHHPGSLHRLPAALYVTYLWPGCPRDSTAMWSAISARRTCRTCSANSRLVDGLIMHHWWSSSISIHYIYHYLPWTNMKLIIIDNGIIISQHGITILLASNQRICMVMIPCCLKYHSMIIIILVIITTVLPLYNHN